MTHDFSERFPGRVLFAEDFDAPGHAAPPEPEIVAPAFTADDIAAARQQAWQDGHDAAAAAAAQSGQAAMRDAVAAIAAGLADARAQAAAIAQQAADELARLLLDSLAAVLPALCERHGETELRRLVRTLLPALTQEPAVTFRLNPGNVAGVTREIAALDADLAAQARIVPCETVAPGDARVTWRGGQAVRDAAAVWAQIAAILAPAGLLPFAASKEVEHAD